MPSSRLVTFTFMLIQSIIVVLLGVCLDVQGVSCHPCLDYLLPKAAENLSNANTEQTARGRFDQT